MISTTCLEQRSRRHGSMLKCYFYCNPLKLNDHHLLSRGFDDKRHAFIRLLRHTPPNINMLAASSWKQHWHFQPHYWSINRPIIHRREFGSKSSTLSLSSSQAPRRLRKVGYLLTATLSILSLNSFAIYTHYHDEIFYSYYPFPIAFDMGYGPSMLPTIGGRNGNKNYLYLRDCWSHRFLWLDYEHCKNCMTSILHSLLLIFAQYHDKGTKTTVGKSDNPISVASSFNRPWQKGDIVTLYNPYTKTLVTKRIIGVGGDYVCALGEYARELYHHQQQQHYRHRHGNDAHVALDDNHGVGAIVVPHDERFPIPFCQVIPSSSSSSSSQVRLAGEDKQQNQHQDAPQWYKNAIIQVPPHHVWLEGDNPMHSTDSRHYGPIPESALRGRVVRRLWPLGTEPVISSNRPTLPPPM